MRFCFLRAYRRMVAKRLIAGGGNCAVGIFWHIWFDFGSFV